MTDAPVIVLNWNGWERTFACLRSLRDASDVTVVWLVDNGSIVDRSDEAREAWPGLRVLRLDQNYGFAGGMNRALHVAAREGYVFAYLLNNDCTVLPGFLRGALEAARSPDVAVVGSRIAYADNSKSLIFDGEYYHRAEKPIDRMLESRRVSSVNGAGMLIRLAALERHGYFDERFFCYHEEVDLCRRLAASGCSLVIAADSMVYHYGKGSDIDGNSMYYRTRNQFLLAEHFQSWARLKGRLFALYKGAAIGSESARLRDAEENRRALAAAIDDGIRGRFGKRQLREDMTVANLRLRLLCALLPAVQWVLPWLDVLRRLTKSSSIRVESSNAIATPPHLASDTRARRI